MINQLLSIYATWKTGSCTTHKAYSETRAWMEQHSVNADDFAFSLACALRDYLAASVG